ncbi:MAG: TMEM165/GDT1 family protein [Calothrix sp. C42_A2020_038]|nr:TMEM165/GDT1 family protein [Calothrix sp. C42_A2020_038]
MLTAFTAGLSIITVSELGDKTFFIAMYLAMQHSRRLIFTAVTAALAAMTTLSVVLGRVASLLPASFIYHAEIALFLGFGLKLIYDAYKMPAVTGCDEVLEEAKEAVIKAEAQLGKKSIWAVWIEGFLMTFVAEWGDRTQLATISLAINNNPFGVASGAILGHAICAAIAVTCGKMLCGRINERQLTFIGGCLFILFGILAVFEKN